MERLTERRRSISPRLRIAVAALVGGTAKSITDAARAASMTRENLSKALQRPHVAGYMREQIQISLGVTAVRAAHRMDALLDSDNAMAAYRASAFSLAVGANIAPPERPGVNISINADARAGWVVDLSEPEPRPPQIIDAVAVEVLPTDDR